MRNEAKTIRHRSSGNWMFAPLLVLILTAYWASSQTQNSAPQSTAEWKEVEQALVRTGQTQPGDVYKFSFPRTDLHVTLNRVEIKAGLALGTWVAFKQFGDQSMVMGDLVLTEDEVEPVMMSLQQNGIQQTALHNHLLGESPHVMYMHIEGHGDRLKLANAIHGALALTKTPAVPAQSSQTGGDLGFDQPKIETILGRSGKVNGGILQFGIARSEPISEAGMTIPPPMGVATAINFQPTSKGNAAITGDFVLLGNEVNPVIKALRDNGIAVTALHSHMLTEEPRLFFMHFWANDDAIKLASGLKAALDKTNSKK